MAQIYYLFSIVYTFTQWGFWAGVAGLFFPVFPMVDLVLWIFK